MTSTPGSSTLTQQQVEHFREHGWVALGQVLDEAELAALHAEEERFRLPIAYGRSSLFVNIQLCHRSEAIRRNAVAGRQVAAIAQLLGPDVCLTHQQFVTKLPDGPDAPGDIPWHQDNGYGRLEPMTDVTVWVPLVDTDAHNGALQILPGSHLGGLLPHESAGVNPVLFEAEVRGTPLTLPLMAGEAVAFSGLLLHGSGPNRSHAPRPAFYLRYCEPSTKMLSLGGRPVLEDPHSWMVLGEARP